MALTLPPPVADLEVRLGLPSGTLADEDLARASGALEDATDLALAEVPHKDTAWRADSPRVVRVVILKAARREFENPRGVSQEAQGEHSAALTDTSGVYLTAREVAQIKRAAFGSAKFVGTVRTPPATE